MTKIMDQQKEMEMLQIEELAYTNMIQHKSLIRMLTNKGIITEEEYRHEVGVVTKAMKSKSR
jgi:hypothetical protein